MGLGGGDVGVLATVGTGAVLLGWTRVGAGVTLGGTVVFAGDGGSGVCVGVGDGCTFETAVGVLAGIELRLPPLEDRIISRASLLQKLQTIEIQKKKAKKEKKKELEKQASLIREELDKALLDRFDKLMARYGFAVAEVEEGACQGCYINVATGMSSAIEGSNDIYVCENCGKFLVASRKKTEKAPVKKTKRSS